MKKLLLPLIAAMCFGLPAHSDMASSRISTISKGRNILFAKCLEMFTPDDVLSRDAALCTCGWVIARYNDNDLYTIGSGWGLSGFPFQQGELFQAGLECVLKHPLPDAAR